MFLFGTMKFTVLLHTLISKSKRAACHGAWSFSKNGEMVNRCRVVHSHGGRKQRRHGDDHREIPFELSLSVGLPLGGYRGLCPAFGEQARADDPVLNRCSTQMFRGLLNDNQGVGKWTRYHVQWVEQWRK